MRVLIVHNRYKQPGGEDVVVRNESELLRQNGHTIVTYLEDNDRIDDMGALQAASSTIWSRESYRRLRALIEAEKPDVAHFHNTFLLISPSAYYACSDAGIPVVQTLHNYRFLCPSATLYRNVGVCEECLGWRAPWPAVVHRCYRDSASQSAVVAAMLIYHRWRRTWKERIAVYIALTESARRRFIAGGLPPNKLVVKANMLAEDPNMGGTTTTAPGDYALYVGRLSSEKGISTLITAWKSLPQVPLKIVGDGPLMGAVQHAFSGDSGHHSVEILGRRQHADVIDIMKRARFLVLPSECYESYPLTLAEAFACGVPSIASGHGAMQDIIGDEETGILFKPGDASDLARTVCHAWNNPERTLLMGRAARARYEQELTPDHNYELLTRIYSRALGSR